MKWKFLKATGEKCELFGAANIFNCKWQNTGKRAAVIDPIYGDEKIFNIYETTVEGITHIFAAGEFSNGVWGFYIPDDE